MDTYWLFSYSSMLKRLLLLLIAAFSLILLPAQNNLVVGTGIHHRAIVADNMNGFIESFNAFHAGEGAVPFDPFPSSFKSVYFDVGYRLLPLKGGFTLGVNYQIDREGVKIVQHYR